MKQAEGRGSPGSRGVPDGRCMSRGCQPAARRRRPRAARGARTCACRAAACAWPKPRSDSAISRAAAATWAWAGSWLADAMRYTCGAVGSEGAGGRRGVGGLPARAARLRLQQSARARLRPCITPRQPAPQPPSLARPPAHLHEQLRVLVQEAVQAAVLARLEGRRRHLDVRRRRASWQRPHQRGLRRRHLGRQELAQRGRQRRLPHHGRAVDAGGQRRRRRARHRGRRHQHGTQGCVHRHGRAHVGLLRRGGRQCAEARQVRCEGCSGGREWWGAVHYKVGWRMGGEVCVTSTTGSTNHSSGSSPARQRRRTLGRQWAQRLLAAQRGAALPAGQPGPARLPAAPAGLQVGRAGGTASQVIQAWETSPVKRAALPPTPAQWPSARLPPRQLAAPHRRSPGWRAARRRLGRPPPALPAPPAPPPACPASA